MLCAKKKEKELIDKMVCPVMFSALRVISSYTWHQVPEVAQGKASVFVSTYLKAHFTKKKKKKWNVLTLLNIWHESTDCLCVVAFRSRFFILLTLRESPSKLSQRLLKRVRLTNNRASKSGLLCFLLHLQKSNLARQLDRWHFKSAWLLADPWIVFSPSGVRPWPISLLWGERDSSHGQGLVGFGKHSI